MGEEGEASMRCGFDTPELCREDTIKRMHVIYTEVAKVLRAVETGTGKEKIPYVIIKDAKKPKRDPTRYSILKKSVLSYLTGDITVVGLFDTLEAALDFLLKLL
jgi:hypothetical protein